ncbi:MAG TPA: hypothetical protein VMP01_14360 [Pirellulaceae bacterium]|nr:hypothetical protein [Pirellulaceae bacterium]
MGRLIGSRVRQATRFRRLYGEILEDRALLAADAVDTQWQNPIDRFDVNADGRVSPSDALVISNAMVANGRRRMFLPETGFPKGAYPDVKLDGFASRADFDMVLWELDRRARETDDGGGFSMLSGDNQPPAATHGIADFLRWGQSDETDTIFGWELFDDPDHEDSQLTFTSSVSGDDYIISEIQFDSVTGQYDIIYYTVGTWGTATVTLKATDPEGLFAEESFDVTSVLVLDYDLQWKDQGTWVDVPTDEGILTDDELRARAIHTEIPDGFVVPISWKHKEWWDASDDVYAVDAIAGNWQYPLITDQYSDGPGSTWYEFQLVAEGDYGFTPEIDFGQFRYAAQMLPAKEVNVYEIQNPVWEGIELSDGRTHFEQEGNPPEFGGGDRFFAERNVPSGRPDSVLHDTVNLVVSLDRAVRMGKEVPVATKLLDPDHYALDPFDNNDTSGSSIDWEHPRDNIMAGGQRTSTAGIGTNGTGGTLATSVVIPGTEVSVKTPMQVLARQPTNNFIAASFNPRISAELIDFHWTDDNTAKRLDDLSAEVSQTPILTIWRHLYIERDSMDEPDLAQGDQPSIIASGNVTAFTGKTITIDQEIKGESSRFQGGSIVLLDANGAQLGIDPFAIVSSTTGVAPQIELSLDVPAGTAKFRDLFDDDVKHDVTVAEMIPDVELFASRFRPACIEIDPDNEDLDASGEEVNQLGGVPFKLNTDTDGLEIEGLHSEFRQSETESDFWVAYLVGAFQPVETEDNDSDSESATKGVTSPWVGVSVLFRETMRDERVEEPASYPNNIAEDDLWRITALHETGHQFGLGHDENEDGTVMHYDSMRTKPVAELEFSPLGLRQLTERDYPWKAG